MEKATILDGKALAAEIRSEVAEKVKADKNRYGKVPGLAAILIGDDPASVLYVNMKKKACNEAGFYTVNHHLPDSITENDLIEIINSLNENEKIHGILVQLPIPGSINVNKVMAAIDYRKDVDGFNPYNMGMLAIGDPRFIPCTPIGIITLLEHYKIKLEGADAVIVGAGTVTGRPLASMMLNRGATVQICHVLTKNLEEKVKKADILVSSTGQSGLIKGSMVKNGAVVVDVGISKKEGKISGDVRFDEVSKIASFVTPVPGGVGPMTIAMLMKNTYDAYKLSLKNNAAG